MYFQGVNYRLTKHARERFRERIFDTNDDTLIIQTCLTGQAKEQAVWKQDKNEGYRLVTVCPYSQNQT